MRTLLPLLLLGCTTTPAVTDKDGSAADDSASDSGTGDNTGCAPLEVTAEVSPYISTVVTVRWTTAEPSTGAVEFGLDETYGRTTPETALGTEHSAIVLGMTADTLVNFRVLGSGEGCQASGDNQTVTTGSLPSGLNPTRATGTATAWPGGFQVLPLQGAGYAIVIVDAAGHYVWYHQTETGGNLMTAFLSADGESVVYCHAGDQGSLDNSKVVRVSLDGSTTTEITFPGLDHDMTELPDGTIAAIVVDEREGGQADSIVELSLDGTMTEVFNAWDHWDPADFGEGAMNWTHGNALDYVAAEDAYYLSMKNLQSLAKVERATGEVVWTMNGRLNQFAFGGDGGTVGMHHQFQVLEDSILFFENSNGDREYSMAVEVEIDEENLTAEKIWSYTADPPFFVFAKGDVHRFADGTTQVVWSSNGEIQNVTPEGEVIWQLDLDLGQGITFVQVVNSMYASQW